MKIEKTKIEGLSLIELDRHTDKRGYFMELFHTEKLHDLSIKPIVQINKSFSLPKVIRGLHYQLPHPQLKIVIPIVGSIYDVVVDIKKSSPTFKQWEDFRLSSTYNYILVVPEHCAHGFYAFESSVVVYFTTDIYYPEAAKTIRWNDPDLGILWPNKNEAILSNQDRNASLLKDSVLFD